MAEKQKKRGDKKLPKAERMTIRKLYAAEQKLNFLQSYAALPEEERGVSKVPAAGKKGMSTDIPKAKITGDKVGRSVTQLLEGEFKKAWEEINK
jgi:hypothetical protein